VNITRTRWRHAFVASSALLAISNAGPVQAKSTPFGEDAFRGCVEKTSVQKSASEDSAPQETPRDRIIATSDNEVRVASRSLAAFGPPAGTENIAAKDSVALACWARLDGVWREDTEVSLDTSVRPQGWESDLPESILLASGTYTDSRHLMIARSDAPEKSLTIIDVRRPDEPTIFVSTDNISFDQVLKRGGPRKKYRAQVENDLGKDLFVDVTSTGRVRLKLDRTFFYRPPPGTQASVSRANFKQQLRADDAFLVSFNLDNLKASRKGYDVTSQDAFYLLNNPKSEVFSRAGPNDFIIEEKRTVPLGFVLVQDGSQGMVYRKSLISSEAGFQQSMSESFGYKATYGNEMTPVQSSVGADFSSEQVNHMRNSQSVSQALAFARQKAYALVVDHPYVTLSDPFVDAIEDARVYGDKDPSYYKRIIQKFGTHYPYAVTYGSTAKVARNFSEQEYTKRAMESYGFKAEASGQYFGPGGQGHYSRLAGNESEFRQSVSDEGATFVAVGGSGSFDENGFSSGTPYPILLDTRPLDELLSPLNFPTKPEVYTKVRKKLREAIIRYMDGKANNLSNVSLAPRTQAQGDYIKKSGGSIVLRLSMKGQNSIGYQDRNAAKKGSQFNSIQYLPRRRVNLFSLGTVSFLLNNDGGVVLSVDGRDNKIWHGANAEWFSNSREVSGLFQVAFEPESTLTFDPIYKNMLSIQQSWSETGKPLVRTRSNFDRFSIDSYSYTINSNGTVTWSDSTNEIEPVTYYPVDKPMFPDAPDLSGQWSIVGQPQNIETLKNINANYMESNASWTTGTGRWQRTGNRELTSSYNTRYELLSNGKLRWHSADGTKTHELVRTEALTKKIIEFGK